MTKLGIMTDENTTSQQTQPTEAATEAAAETATDTDAQQQDQGAQSAAESAAPVDFEPLTATYERLRHSTDPAELSEFARRPLPDRADQAAFSRATALLEAVAGNPHTPVADRVFLADTMPFPNVLVKLSEDPEPSVRQAVAANGDDKNWLVGRLTKDPVPEVRDTALKNKRTSWKMRAGPHCGCGDIGFLGRTWHRIRRGSTGGPFLDGPTCRGAESQYVRSDACQVGQRPLGRGAARRGKPPLSTLLLCFAAQIWPAITLYPPL